MIVAHYATRQARRRPLRAAGVVIALALMAAIASSCASPKASLSPTATDPCFRTLGVAAEAVHHRGHYAGVQPVSAAALDQALSRFHPHRIAPPPGLNAKVGAICLVFFHGDFSPTQVNHPWPPGSLSKRFAVVIVSEKHYKVITTLLVDHPILRSTNLFLSLR